VIEKREKSTDEKRFRNWCKYPQSKREESIANDMEGENGDSESYI